MGGAGGAGGIPSVIRCPFPLPVAGTLGRRTIALYAPRTTRNNRFRDAQEPTRAGRWSSAEHELTLATSGK
jgi:hypothetical protein